MNPGQQCTRIARVSAFQFVIGPFRTATALPLTNHRKDDRNGDERMMEASMKTMSWSRYHALSWSFSRIRTHLHGRGARRARRAAKAAAIAAATAAAAPAVRPGAAGPGRQGAGGFRFLAGASRALSRIFRTKALPAETDI
jgi:hypothetical protein